jgi:ATP-dependent helicase STH1/SNF2
MFSVTTATSMLTGVDFARLQAERDRVNNRINARKLELEALLGMAESGTSRGVADVDDQLKIKALIEYKSLCLVDKQKALRQEMASLMLNENSLPMIWNRAMFRHPKKDSFYRYSITELEKQRLEERRHHFEQEEHRKHTERIRAIIIHGQKLKSAARAKEAKAQRLGLLMIEQHRQIKEKEELKTMESKRMVMQFPNAFQWLD